MKDIPLYNLDLLSKWGIFVKRMSVNPKNPRTKQAHRDKNYVFVFQESGTSIIMVDFKPVVLHNRIVYCIFPGQVHLDLSTGNAEGYTIAMNTELLPDFVRDFFETSLTDLIPAQFEDSCAVRLKACIQLLEMTCKDPSSSGFELQIVQSMSQSLAIMFGAIFYRQMDDREERENRHHSLTRQFKSHLRKQYKTLKSPAHYAQLLHVSPAYLNQVVKKSTGMPLSHWIHREIIIESKRLLFYTDLTVREIAYSLGYEDPTYFSRFFRKLTAESPLSFRQHSRK